MRFNLLKHNNLMPAQRLCRCRWRSERRERLEAWAASDPPISHSQYLLPRAETLLEFRHMDDAAAMGAIAGRREAMAEPAAISVCGIIIGAA